MNEQILLHIDDVELNGSVLPHVHIDAVHYLLYAYNYLYIIYYYYLTSKALVNS